VLPAGVGVQGVRPVLALRRAGASVSAARIPDGTLMIKRWLLVRYVRWGAKRAVVDTRYLAGWCDYRPAHNHVKWTATVDGDRFGQSCTRHVGALLVDAQRAGVAMIEPAEREPSRLERVVVV
jgi:hypothetical protein